jgi:ADP-heptose:LPS heptosyltransferase
MKKAIIINGGFGRQICSIPALEKLYRTEKDFIIIAEGGIEAFQGHPTLYAKAYPISTKNLFENYLKDRKIICPEPYRVNNYYNQQCNLIEAFDKEINQTDDHSDLGLPSIYLSKEEEVNAANIINQAKLYTNKKKIVVLQPFGRGIYYDGNFLYDKSSRSLTKETYLYLAKKLSEHYCVITMSEFPIQEDKYTFKPANLSLRTWMAIIEISNYFVGCDSSGQHIARSFNVPGSVILGSTFAENVSYPEYFQILEKDEPKMYSPIRITDYAQEADLADRLNDRLMDFDLDLLEDFCKKIQNDIENKTQTDILYEPFSTNIELQKNGCC